MTLTPDSEALTYDPPGPGSWLLDSVHVARPFSRWQAEIHPRNLAEGFRATARRYGLLLDTLDWRMVNGFAYFAVAPVAADAVEAGLGDHPDVLLEAPLEAVGMAALHRPEGLEDE